MWRWAAVQNLHVLLADNSLTPPGYGVMQPGAGYQSGKLDVSLTLGNA
jgi:hypothetical protein